jgi:hypothetical protein
LTQFINALGTLLLLGDEGLLDYEVPKRVNVVKDKGNPPFKTPRRFATTQYFT